MTLIRLTLTTIVALLLTSCATVEPVSMEVTYQVYGLRPVYLVVDRIPYMLTQAECKSVVSILSQAYDCQVINYGESDFSFFHWGELWAARIRL